MKGYPVFGHVRASNTLSELPPGELSHLGLTKWGAPRHPLYLHGETEIQTGGIMQHAFIIHGLERPKLLSDYQKSTFQEITQQL